MTILTPVLILILTSLTLILLQSFRSKSKYPWATALGGVILAFTAVIFWQIQYPDSLTISTWQSRIVLNYKPMWLIDGVSWPFSLSLTALNLAVVITSVVRDAKNAFSLAGGGFLTALGILAVAAGDPVTLTLVWTAIDLFEFITMLPSSEGGNQRRILVLGLTIRIIGTSLVILACEVSSSAYFPVDFDLVATKAGVLLLLGSALRLGVLILHLPYRKENSIRRGYGTIVRIVSAIASLVLLARIPAGVFSSSWITISLIFTALVSLFAGYKWLTATDDLTGRPFWLLGMVGLAASSILQSYPSGSVSWGITLILSGGLIFLYTARNRSILFLPLIGMWGISSLPYSPTAAAWSLGNGSFWVLMLFFLPVQALLMAGFLRHAMLPGEKSLDSQDQRTRITYLIGLGLLAGTTILLSLWGWVGAKQVGTWWTALPVFILTGLFFLFAGIKKVDLKNPISTWGSRLHWSMVINLLKALQQLLEGIARLITTTLEGEGGILWSVLLLVLILSLLSLGAG